MNGMSSAGMVTNGRIIRQQRGVPEVGIVVA
jgi:hypothetical protein